MKNGGTKVLLVILIILIIVAGGVLAYKINNDKKKAENPVNETAIEDKQEEEKDDIKIYNGNERPIAVMIDNHKDAWPQAGLQQAYMVYEIIVEGGETRLMALFKGADLDKIGPVRSARHYFLDYAMENDAILVHFGQSPQASSDIKKYSINDINGISEDGTTFWRVKDKAAPHNAVTSTEKIKKSAESKNYRMKSNKKSVLNYVSDEVNLENGEVANIVTIPHSDRQIVKYEYDKDGTYIRSARNQIQKDWDTSESITTKNIIIVFCDNYELNDSENKGRQGLRNIGTFDGYYITNGKAEKIKCTKESRDSKTEYKDLQGNIIKVNDGNTFVHICPTDANVTISE